MEKNGISFLVFFKSSEPMSLRPDVGAAFASIVPYTPRTDIVYLDHDSLPLKVVEVYSDLFLPVGHPKR